MSRYNLIDEKWIPVRFPDGRREELGIRDTLLRSKEIAAIEDPSPLVVAALHRFLLAVLYRALEGPTDIDQAKALFKNGLPYEKIEAYLEKWRDRFWLFDENYPFYQIPDFSPKKWQAWSKIAAERNADNARVLFDHIGIKDPGQISLAASARLLLAVQTFDLAVAKSEFVQPLDAPSARAAFFIVIGNTLDETLCFGLKWQGRHISQNDSALWEREPDRAESLKRGKSKTISGYADLYTWPSRSVIFKGNDTNSIRNLGFASGLTKANDELFVDPMLCYQRNKESGFIPLKLHEDKEFWREFDSILPGGDDQAPLIVGNAISLRRAVKGKWPIGVLVCGQKTRSGQAKIDFWRASLFALPQALLGPANVNLFIQSLLMIAEDVADSLRSALWAFYLNIMVRRKIDKENGLKREEKIKISEMVGSAWPLHLYWSTLESRFHEILCECVNDEDSEEVRCRWFKSIYGTLNIAWEHHRAAVRVGDAWSIRALEKSESPIRRKLKELKDEIIKLDPRKEDA